MSPEPRAADFGGTREGAVRSDEEKAAEGEQWIGPKKAAWMCRRLERDDTRPRRGWSYLRRLGYRLLMPRPAHDWKANSERQAALKEWLNKSDSCCSVRLPL